MFANIFTNRLFIGALAIFIFCVSGSLLYMQHVQRVEAEKLAETQARVAQWNERQNQQPTAEAPVVEQPAEVGHFHEDGTWHAAPREEVNEEAVSNSVNVYTPSAESTLQWLRSGKRSLHIPAHLLEAQRLASVDTARSKAAFRAALPEDSFSHDFEVVVKASIRKGMDIISLPAEERSDMETAITHNLMTAAFDEATALSGIFIDTGNPVYKDRSHEIYSWKDPYYALVPKPKLNADQLSQLRKAADEFDALLPKNPLGGEPLPNPYRERLQEEENR